MMNRTLRQLCAVRPAGGLLPALGARGFASPVFDQHVQLVTKLKAEPENEDKLKLYALFKQATAGPNTKPKPGALDFVGKYKWQAWADLGQMPKEQAETEYVKKVEQLVCAIGLEDGVGDSAAAAAPAGDSGDSLVITLENQIKTIRFNRPSKKNAFSPEMYITITEQLNQASKDEKVKAVFLTGTGDYYSSGNDLGAFMKVGGDVKAYADKACDVMINFVDAFIECEKPVIAAVNGHAVGILVTTLGLCDLVIASDRSSFLAPFSSTAQVPEGAATYTFPRMLGTSVASQMLLFNRKLSAQEALTHGLIGAVVPDAQFAQYVQDFQKDISENCATHSIVWGKQLMRPEKVKQEMREAIREEAVMLKRAWFSPEFPKFIAKFFQRKK